MSAKNLDSKNRWRNITVGFRVLPEENELLNKTVALSGLPKQECLSRRKFGRHVVMPLHFDIAVSCRKIGFDNLNPILWHKISNASFMANTNSSILGKPYKPNAIIKNDVEYILIERKPGGYRKPTAEQHVASMI